jgi:serine protease Do
MRSLGIVLAFWLALSIGAWQALGDEIRLGDGKAVIGEVVKQTPDEVFVDIGHTIISIPVREILEIVEEEESAAGDGEARTVDIFTQVDAKEMSVRDNVDRIGEGVVLVKRPGALGSGSIISKDGYAITNAHVVEGEQDITITVFHKTDKEFEKKVFKKVKIIAVNPYVDLALLKIDSEELGDFELTVVPVGDMNRLKVGEPVFAIGNPLGLERSVSEGIVSSKNRAQEGLTFIQTTAAVNPGNSGGPLFNLKGEMIGVTSWILVGTEGLNFAIPADRVKDFIRNRDAFAYDKDNPNSGYHYLEPPKRKLKRDM